MSPEQWSASMSDTHTKKEKRYTNSQVVKHFNTLNHYSNISGGGGNTSLSINALEKEEKLEKKTQFT